MAESYHAFPLKSVITSNSARVLLVNAITPTNASRPGMMKLRTAPRMQRRAYVLRIIIMRDRLLAGVAHSRCT